MEFYREYPIGCKSCNEQLACFSKDYEDYLASGLTVEEALNALGITNYCSRAAMMNPPTVTFNMENRQVIEGFKSVEAADEADAQNESTSRPIFSACMGAGPQIQVPILPIPQDNIIQGITTPEVTRPTLPGVQTLILMLPTQTVIQPIIPDVKLDDLGPGIPVTVAEVKKFQEPIMVGIPVINSDPTLTQATIYVGAGKQSRVLNGRTHLAR